MIEEDICFILDFCQQNPDFNPYQDSFFEFCHPQVVHYEGIKFQDTGFKLFQNPLVSGNLSSNILQKSNTQLKTPTTRIPTTIQTSLSRNNCPIIMENTPTRMELIVAATYAPLALPRPLNALPQGDYLKYLPKFIREGDGISVEDHLALFYSYANNQNIEN